VAQALKDLAERGAQDFVLDLRGNLGGLLDEAACIAGHFVGSGRPLVTQHDPRNDNVIVTNVTNLPYQGFSLTGLWGDPIPYKQPLVILIDAQSASASEIIAGVMQDRGRAWIVGQRSFGKGTVQLITSPTAMNQPLKLPGQLAGLLKGTGMAFTVARFHLPSGRSNQLVGIAPDVEVLPLPELTEAEYPALREVDIYRNAVPAATQQPEPKRPAEETAAMNECVRNQGTAVVTFKHSVETKTGETLPDLQLLTALDVLACQR